MAKEWSEMKASAGHMGDKWTEMHASANKWSDKWDGMNASADPKPRQGFVKQEKSDSDNKVQRAEVRTSESGQHGREA